MSDILYVLNCQHCHFKKLTDGSDLVNYVEVKTCQSCSGSRRFKCPKCGYLMKVSSANVKTVNSSQKFLDLLKSKETEKKKKLEEELRRIAKDRRRKLDDGN